MDVSLLDQAFPSSYAKLKRSFSKIATDHPEYAATLNDVSKYIISLRGGGTAVEDEPSNKKRKLDVVAGKGENGSGSGGDWEGEPLLVVEGVSFSVPARKKFNLKFYEGGIKAVAPAGGDGFEVLYRDIQFAACLPVPEKAARQFNFCLFPTGSDGLSDSSGADAWVVTVADGAPKGVSGPAAADLKEDATMKSLLMEVLKNKKVTVAEPSSKIFASSIPQSHRKGEDAYHVKAHRGSKDGYLFFLSTGILWAFKKPLVYISFDSIESVSYTSITKRTFNLAIKIANHRGGQELEFSMIDQADHGEIDEYVRKHRLQDASMAEERRAKRENVNGKAGDEDGAAGAGEMDESALERALQDAEDEEEEDYDPNAESEGSDSDDDGSSDDDDDDFDEDVDAEDELGSEMEDVQEK